MQTSARPWKKHLATFYRHPVRVPEIFEQSAPLGHISLPDKSGALSLTKLQPRRLRLVNLCPFIAKLKVKGCETEPILMYFLVLQARRGATVDRLGLLEDCSDIPVAGLLRDLCPKELCDTKVIFEMGGILEFCYMVAPPELNGKGLWPQAANTVIKELISRYQPGLLLLKAHPMELTTVGSLPDWAASRSRALKRLYAKKLGVADLARDGWMWRPLRSSDSCSLLTDRSEVMEEADPCDFDTHEGGPLVFMTERLASL